MREHFDEGDEILNRILTQSFNAYDHSSSDLPNLNVNELAKISIF